MNPEDFAKLLDEITDAGALTPGAYVVLCWQGRPYKLVSSADWIAATAGAPSSQVAPPKVPISKPKPKPAPLETTLFDQAPAPKAPGAKPWYRRPRKPPTD